MVLDRGKKNGDGTAEIAKIQRRTENKRKNQDNQIVSVMKEEEKKIMSVSLSQIFHD
jgi:hypothetical protein